MNTSHCNPSMRDAFDTPIGRRKLASKFADEAVRSAKAALALSELVEAFEDGNQPHLPQPLPESVEHAEGPSHGRAIAMIGSITSFDKEVSP